MTDGKKFLEMFDSGMKYSEIAAKYNCSRNTVAGEISDYRRANNIPVKHPEMAKNTKKSFQFRSSKEDKKLRKKRIKALKECPVVNGVTKCPPTGYGSIYD